MINGDRGLASEDDDRGGNWQLNRGLGNERGLGEVNRGLRE